MVLVGAATIVTDLAPEHRRGEALSLYSLGLWGGLALGPILGELVLGTDRFTEVWLLAAGFCIVSAAIGTLLPETTPERAAGEAAARTRIIHPAAVGPGLVLALTVFGFAGLGTFAALYARELGMDGAGAVFLVFSMVVVATRIVARQAPDRLGPKRASGAALLLISAGLLTIGFWNTPAGLYAGTVVLAFGQALAFPALMTLAVNGAPATRAQLRRRDVHGVHRARLRDRSAGPRRCRLGGGLRRRLRRVRDRAVARRAPARANRRAARDRRRRPGLSGGARRALTAWRR